MADAGRYYGGYSIEGYSFIAYSIFSYFLLAKGKEGTKGLLQSIHFRLMAVRLGGQFYICRVRGGGGYNAGERATGAAAAAADLSDLIEIDVVRFILAQDLIHYCAAAVAAYTVGVVQRRENPVKQVARISIGE